MGLSSALSRLAAGRVHVLLLEIPGDPLLRLQVEAAIAGRGWVVAPAPADADVLLVVGKAPEAFGKIADGVWNQIPSPRHRCSVTTVDVLAATLEAIPAVLGDEGRQIRDAQQRPRHVAEHPEGMKHDAGGELDADGGAEDDGTDMGGMDMDGMDMGGMDMGGMDMDMSGPAGIPLASGDDSDRDGLEMDVTHLSLGPLLPHWPAGLVVHCTLHGDVIGEASLDFLHGPAAADSVAPHPLAPAAGPAVQAAVLCDAAGHLLSVAGWETVALKIHRVRDGLITGESPQRMAAGLRRATRQVERSRTLRWSLAGIPTADGADARSVLIVWLRNAAALLAGQEIEPPGADWPASLDDIRKVLIGQELAAARLIVACVAPSRMAGLSGAVHG